ncbi:hypothetical protein RZY48_000129 [Vibrio navarrensis]|uniref:Uncharacterized protein n=1 Tax=Vibrio navarrensis TaxID=29495 RepID=A0AAI9CQX9_9VIBR|nr:hypothetical protein [Vibrio navarrensis]
MKRKIAFYRGLNRAAF